MRKTLTAILMATAISTPALAKERGRGDDARVERSHKFEKRADRNRVRVERRADRAEARTIQRRAKVTRAAERRIERRAERRADQRRIERRVAERRPDLRRSTARATQRRTEARIAERLRDRRAGEQRALIRARAEAQQERRAVRQVVRERQRTIAAARRIQDRRVRYQQPVRVVRVVREAPRYVEVRRPVYRVYEDADRRYPAYDGYVRSPSYAYAQEPYYPSYAPSSGGLLGGGMGDIASVLLPVALSQFGLGDSLGLGSLAGLGSGLGSGYGVTDPAYGYDAGYGNPGYYEPGVASYGYDQGLGGESSLIELASLALGSGYLGGGDMLGLGGADALLGSGLI